MAERPAVREFIDDFCLALEEEITWQKERGGRPYRIAGGRLLHWDIAGALYYFSLEMEAVLPDGTPVRVRCGAGEIEGEVVSLRGFDLILMLTDNIGEVVEEAEMFSSPWFLLAALRDRLREIPFHRAARALEVMSPILHPAMDEDEPAEIARAVAKQAVTFVWGPPGTGKTESLARLVRTLYEEGRRVLITSHANVAVDAAVERAALHLDGRLAAGEVVRYGFARLPSVRRSELLAANLAADRDPDLKLRRDELEAMRGELISALRRGEKVGGRLKEVAQALGAVQGELKAAEAEIARDARVLGCTLAKTAVDPVIFHSDFDVVVLDEASMAYIPQVVYAASLARHRMVVIGDFRQLAPVSEAETPAVERWLKRDVFDEAGIIRAVDAGRNPAIVVLREQWRMHPAIARFVNEAVYGGILRDAPDMAARRSHIVDREPWSGKTLILVDVSGLPALCHREGYSRFNPLSALLATTLAGPSLDAGLSVALLTPYVLQARLMRILGSGLYGTGTGSPYERLDASTVHRFQGGEADVVVLDCVDAFPQRGPGKILSSNTRGQAMRLINVAVTRARGKLVVIAHREFLEGRLADASIVRALFAYADRHGLVVRAPDLLKGVLPETTGGGEAGDTTSIKWYASRWSALTDWATDAREAGEIQVDWPAGEGSLDDNVTRVLQQALRAGARMVVRAGAPARLPHWIRPYTIISPSIRIPCAALDRRVIWYGFPWPGDARTDRLCARLTGGKVCGLLMSLLGMDLRETRRTANRYAGLRAYVEHNLSCPACSRPLTIRMGREGKPFLGCTAYRGCGSPPVWITLDLVNEYLSVNQVTCPRGHLLVARRTKHGPRAVCAHGHGCRFSLSLEDIM